MGRIGVRPWTLSADPAVARGRGRVGGASRPSKALLARPAEPAARVGRSNHPNRPENCASSQSCLYPIDMAVGPRF